MHALRTVVATTVVLISAGGLAGSVVAQEDADGIVRPPTEFSGRVVCCDDYHEGTMKIVPLGRYEEGSLIRDELRGGLMRTDVDGMSDPRFDGTWSMYMAGDRYVDRGADTSDHPMLITGLLRIDNDEGTWQGSAPDGNMPDGPEVTWGMAMLTGEGAYEGLTTAFWSRLLDDQCFPGHPDTRCVHDVRGLVFEGEMPPLPEPVELSAEE